MSRSRQPGLQFALALAVALGAFIPPAHVHEADDHHPSVAHRHFAAHHHSQTEIGDPDERVIWLDDASVSATPFFRVAGVLAILVRPFETVVPSVEWIATFSFDTAPPHGPPKPVLAPRAPPLPA